MKIGIDIGGSHIGIGLLNDENQIIKKIEKDITYDEQTKKNLINYVERTIDELIQENDVNFIGIVTPGILKNGMALNLVNLGIEKLDFNHLINKYSNIVVKLKNDSKAAGLAEKQYGALKEYNDAVFLCLGTGIGSAVFLNNNLLINNRNTGFELGHMIINKDGIKCNCGKRGCFETYCSIKRFKESIRDALDIENCSSQELLEIIQKEKNNEKVKQIIDEYIENMIVGLSNIIDIFKPEAICLGGSFVFFRDIFYEKLVVEMNNRKYVFDKNNIPKILLAELKNDAGIIGAVL